MTQKALFELPQWIDRAAWDGWVEMREKRKPKAFTDRAKDMAIRKLEELKQEGFDAGQVLDQSTFHGWIGLFPVHIEVKRAPDSKAGARNNMRPVFSADDKAYYREQQKKYPDIYTEDYT